MLSDKELKLTVEIAEKLRLKLKGRLSKKLNDSQLWIDLADIHEICRVYLTIIERILSVDEADKKTLEDLLYEIDIELFEHLPYHSKSLKKLLPKVIKEVDSH